MSGLDHFGYQVVAEGVSRQKVQEEEEDSVISGPWSFGVSRRLPGLRLVTSREWDLSFPQISPALFLRGQPDFFAS